MTGHIFIILFSAYALFSGGLAFSYADSIRHIKERGALRVAMVQGEHVPYAFHRDGRLQGIDVSIAQRLAERLGVKLELIRTAVHYDDVVAQVASGKADIGVSNLSITLKRALKIYYSRPYIHLNKAILLKHSYFARHKSVDEVSLKDFFKGPNQLGVIRGSAYVEFAREIFPDAHLVLYDQWTDLVEDVKSGKVAGAFRDQFEIEKIIFTEPHGLLNYMVVQLDLPQDKVAIIVPKEYPHLLHWINYFVEIELETVTGRQLAMMYLENKGKRYAWY